MQEQTCQRSPRLSQRQEACDPLWPVSILTTAHYVAGGITRTGLIGMAIGGSLTRSRSRCSSP